MYADVTWILSLRQSRDLFKTPSSATTCVHSFRCGTILCHGKNRTIAGCGKRHLQIFCRPHLLSDVLRSILHAGQVFTMLLTSREIECNIDRTKLPVLMSCHQRVYEQERPACPGVPPDERVPEHNTSWSLFPLAGVPPDEELPEQIKNTRLENINIPRINIP